MRGFGKSVAPERPYSDVTDLHGLLRFLNVPRVHLVGLSLGGRIAIDFALTYPDVVKSLVAAGPGLSGFEWSGEANKRSWEILMAARDEGTARAVELWLQDPYLAPAMANPSLAPRVRRLAQENARCWLANPLLGKRLTPPAVKRLGEIRTPTLVVVGEKDVPDIQAIVKLLEKGVPNVRMVTIAGAGHLVNMEKPEAFNRAVLAFLKDPAKPTERQPGPDPRSKK